LSIFFTNTFLNNDIKNNNNKDNKYKVETVIVKANCAQIHNNSFKSDIYRANFIPFLGSGNYKQVSHELEKLIAPHLLDAKNGSIEAKNSILEISYNWININAKKLAGKYDNRINPEDIASDTYMLILDSNLFNGSFDNTFLGYLYTSMKHSTIGRLRKLNREENKFISLNAPIFHNKKYSSGTNMKVEDLLIDQTHNLENTILSRIDIEDLSNFLSQNINSEELGLLKSFYVDKPVLDKNLEILESESGISEALISIFDKFNNSNNKDMPELFNVFIKKLNETRLKKYILHLNISAKGLVELYNQLSKEMGKTLEFGEFQSILKTRIDERCQVGLILDEDKKLLNSVLGLGSSNKWVSQAKGAELLKLNISESTPNKRISSATDKIIKSIMDNYRHHISLTASGFVKLYDQLTVKNGTKLTFEEFQNELKIRINDKCKKGIILSEDAELLKIVLGLGDSKKWLSQAEAARILKLKLSISGSNCRINSAIEKINKPDIENYLNHLSKSASEFKLLYEQLSKENGENLKLEEFQNILKERINNRLELQLITNSEKEFVELVLGLGSHEKWFNQSEANNYLNLNSSLMISKKRIVSVIDKIYKTDVENYLDHLKISASEFVKFYDQISEKYAGKLTLNEFQNELKNRINDKNKKGLISDENKNFLDLVLGLGSEKNWLNKTEAAQIIKSKKSDMENYIKHLNQSAKGLDELYNLLSKEKGENLGLKEFQHKVKNRINKACKADLLTTEDSKLLELVLGLAKDRKLYSQSEAAQKLNLNLSSSTINLHVKNSLDIITKLNIEIINIVDQKGHLTHLNKSA